MSAPPTRHRRGPGAPSARHRRAAVSTLLTRHRRALLLGLLVVGLVAAAWLATPRPSDGLPLSPDSTASDGTRALTQVLEALGAEVVLGRTPPEEATTGLVLMDNMGEGEREEWRDLARRGGTLVIVDAFSELAPPPVGDAGFGLLDPSIGRQCDVEALAGADRVQPSGGVTFDVPEGAVGCFPRGEGHWLVAVPEGAGAVVAIGGPSFLTNGRLGEADHAALAAALLVPAEGTVVAIAPPDFAAADAEGDIVDLVPDSAWLVMLQLLVAFLIAVGWRARRLGAPVVETQPVALPGSELVMGVGGMYQQTGAARHAASLMREDARRTVARRLGLGSQASPEEAVEAAVAAGVERRLAEAALTDPLIDDERSLVALGGTVERLRAALYHLDDAERPRRQGAARV